jgi:hypothetical protein
MGDCASGVAKLLKLETDKGEESQERLRLSVIVVRLLMLMLYEMRRMRCVRMVWSGSVLDDGGMAGC